MPPVAKQIRCDGSLGTDASRRRTSRTRRISFPSQREECATKAAELGGRIVCRVHRPGGRPPRRSRRLESNSSSEAKERDARRFDAVIIYSTSRLSRDLFHALAYERELARAGIESSTR